MHVLFTGTPLNIQQTLQSCFVLLDFKPPALQKTPNSIRIILPHTLLSTYTTQRTKPLHARWHTSRSYYELSKQHKHLQDIVFSAAVLPFSHLAGIQWRIYLKYEASNVWKFQGFSKVFYSHKTRSLPGPPPEHRTVSISRKGSGKPQHRLQEMLVWTTALLCNMKYSPVA